MLVKNASIQNPELSHARLRGVLKGKLLARVLAEADETRERVRELDALDALDGDFGAWESERRA